MRTGRLCYLEKPARERLYQSRGQNPQRTRPAGRCGGLLLRRLDGVAVRRFFDEEQPEYVFLAAAFVGGIMANSIYRADFIYKNLQIQQNVIGESFRHNVKKLLFLGSTCIYPREPNSR